VSKHGALENISSQATRRSRQSGTQLGLLNTGHRYGTIANTMKIIKAGKKGKHLNTLEKYTTYTEPAGTIYS
jgi:hypothetical protein